MEHKIKRFIELSKEFTVKISEIYPDNNENCIVSISGGYTILDSNQNTPQLTRLKRFENSAKEKIEKAKRYEEYLTLQSSLSEYYKAVEKLNNN